MKKTLVICAFLISFIFTACTNNSNSEVLNEGTSQEIISGEGFDQSEITDITDNYGETLVVGEQRKIITTANLSIETLEFDKSLEILEGNVNSFGGYIESSEVYQGGINNNYKEYKNANLTVRVPKENFNNFLEKIGDSGVIISKNISGEDISGTYFDKESRLRVLKAQEERYIELIDKADTITEILEVEKYLTEVTSEIESITGYLEKMDGLIDYSTVNISIQEVREATVEEPENLGGKIAKVFKESIKSLEVVVASIVLCIVASIPYIIIILIIWIILYIAYKKRKIRSKNKDK